MDYHYPIAEALQEQLGDAITFEQIKALLEKPKLAEHGDLAFPAFQLARILRKSPVQIAQELADKVSSPYIEKAVAVGPYVNFSLDRTHVGREVLNEVIREGEAYGNHSLGNGRNVPIDMSSPNIAKPMSMGHLRSTVIGNALANIVQKMDYKPVKINHLGDWGTQFGKLIVAYKKWGTEEAVRANPIQELLRLYVEFHEQA